MQLRGSLSRVLSRAPGQVGWAAALGMVADRTTSTEHTTHAERMLRGTLSRVLSRAPGRVGWAAALGMEAVRTTTVDHTPLARPMIFRAFSTVLSGSVRAVDWAVAHVIVDACPIYTSYSTNDVDTI